MSIQELTRALREFNTDREWGQFHTPKNLSMALSVEAAELLEIFQWASDGGFTPDGRTRENIADELADVLIYTSILADTLNIDLMAAARQKIQKNGAKYPTWTPTKN